VEALQNDFWNCGFDLRPYLVQNRLNNLLLPVAGEISSSIKIRLPATMVPSLPASTEMQSGPVHYSLHFQKVKQEIQVDEKVLINDLSVKPVDFTKFASFLDEYYAKHFWTILISNKTMASK